MDLLMVRDRETGRFLYTERLERRPGETSWEYVRRSVRREAQVKERFKGETLQVIVGWGPAPSRSSSNPTLSTGPCRTPTTKPGRTAAARRLYEPSPPGT